MSERVFKEVEPLEMPHLAAWVIRNDPSVVQIVEPDEGRAVCCSYAEAIALQDWLGRALGKDSGRGK